MPPIGWRRTSGPTVTVPTWPSETWIAQKNGYTPSVGNVRLYSVITLPSGPGKLKTPEFTGSEPS